MKKIQFFQIIILVVIVFVIAGCKKELPAIGSGTVPINQLPPPPLGFCRRGGEQHPEGDGPAVASTRHDADKP